ncbi:DNA internalization-related competence protein ComEC/Rec2 [Thiohalorhabdus methylotrophus]|uniref:DNA internalization-related competence protein ComEC/Rec2 n=1 Tax=Thiohalorhabdus methylotrophus TaxID=3242694 RepID=A0ABV4TY91_9GAMM
MWAGIATFALGILAFHRLPYLLPPWLLGLPLLGAVIWLYLRPGWAPALITALLAGFFWQGLTAIQQQANPFPGALERRTVQIEGRVAGSVEEKPGRRRFRFRAARLRGPEGPWRKYGGDLRLSWYRTAPADLAYGQRWRLSVRVRRPRGFRNPGGFDYARYLRSRGLSGTGYVRREPAPRKLATGAGRSFRGGLEALRRRVQAATEAAGTAAPLARALTVGKRDRLAPETWTVLQATGTAHLVAISGLHVGWVAFLLFLVTRYAWGRLPGAALLVPAPRFAAVAALVGATAYALLAGLSLPTQRALIMVAVGLGAWLLGRPFHFPRALAMAALLVLLWSPDSLLGPGFWLSFTAVGAIGLLLSGPGAGWDRWRRAAAVQLAVVAAVSPWLAYWFGQVSLVAPLANAVAIPYFSFVVVPLGLVGALAAVLGLAELAEHAMAATGWLLSVAMHFLEWLETWPGVSWSLPRPGVAGVGLMLAGLGLLLKAPRPFRWLGPALVAAPLAWMGPPDLPTGQARVWVLDVGQGSATVVETARHVAVVDCGPRFSATFNAGEALVAPFLHSRGWAAVDRLVVSHGDNDHLGGCAGLRERVAIRETAGAPAGGGRVLNAGDGWRWDGVRFRVLAPAPGGSAEGNAASRVLEVTAAGQRVLLPGDLEEAGERRLVRAGELREQAVVVAPHHGSATSSSPAFVAATDPEWVVYSTGYRNRWGFPRPEVAARYARVGAAALNTATDGAVRIRLGAEVRVNGYRQAADRYWHAGAAPPPLSSLADMASIL